MRTARGPGRFDAPSALEALWPRLVASYAVDAEAAKYGPSRTFSAKATEVLLEHVSEQRCEAFDAVGQGRDLRFEAQGIIGQALTSDRHLLHLSVFPPAKNRPSNAGAGPGIQPPSRRR